MPKHNALEQQFPAIFCMHLHLIFHRTHENHIDFHDYICSYVQCSCAHSWRSPMLPAVGTGGADWSIHHWGEVSMSFPSLLPLATTVINKCRRSRLNSLGGLWMHPQMRLEVRDSLHNSLRTASPHLPVSLLNMTHVPHTLTHTHLTGGEQGFCYHQPMHTHTLLVVEQEKVTLAYRDLQDNPLTAHIKTVIHEV